MDRDGFALFYQAYVRAAALGAARGSSVVDPDDVEMAIWEELFARFDYFAKATEAHVKWFVAHKANEAAAKERRDFEYFRGAFVYTANAVRQILEEAVWVELDSVVDVAARVDVMTAYAKLNDNWRRVLFRRFGLREELSAADTRTSNRAINRIADLLNDSIHLELVEPDEVGVTNGTVGL